jgi:hypothetical protein
MEAENALDERHEQRSQTKVVEVEVLGCIRFLRFLGHLKQ